MTVPDTDLPPDSGSAAPEAEPASAADFDQIYDRCKDDVFRFACHLAGDRAEAEDLFQEVWLRVARHLTEMPGPAALRPWLLRIAVNLHRDALRKKRVRRLFFLSRAGERTSQASPCGEEVDLADPAAKAERATLHRRIDLAVSALPDRQQSVFVLREIEGLKQEEIAGILGIPVGTVKSLMHRAVRRLQKELADCRPGLEKVKCDVKMLSV
jgi:RNA polymerase sigma-70 factor, ECF subfamily